MGLKSTKLETCRFGVPWICTKVVNEKEIDYFDCLNTLNVHQNLISKLNPSNIHENRNIATNQHVTIQGSKGKK